MHCDDFFFNSCGVAIEKPPKKRAKWVGPTLRALKSALAAKQKAYMKNRFRSWLYSIGQEKNMIYSKLVNSPFKQLKYVK